MRTFTFGKSVIAASVMLGMALASSELRADDKEHKDHEKHAAKQTPEKFIKEAAEANQLEIRAAELAQRQGESQQVKQLASTMAQHHRQAGEQLQRLAEQQNIQTETRLTGKHQQQWSKLQGKSGQELDKAFITFVVKDHKKDIAMLEKCSKEFTSNPELKAYIDRNLPMVRQHLEMAQNAAEELNIDPATLAADTEEDTESAVGAPGTTERGVGEPESQEDQPQQDNEADIEIEADTSLQPDNERP